MSENLTIRRVARADARAIAALYNHYVSETTVSFETDPVSEAEMGRRIAEISAAHPYFVCEEAGRLLGWCCAHPWKERAAYRHTWETTIYLADEARGRGLGEALMRRLIAECRAGGECHALIACVTTENEASCRFHRRLGFREVSAFKQVGRKFGRWLDVTDWELLLRQP